MGSGEDPLFDGWISGCMLVAAFVTLVLALTLRLI